MHDGHLGCGRRHWDGSGANNHAVDHGQNSGHPIVCKLGTITPEGTASIYCYKCDDDVFDSKLAEHLKVLGINIAT
jgi:ubiquitin carboxyl-terminal hydrolase 5/13